MAGDIRKELETSERLGKQLLKAAENGKWKECIQLIEEGAPVNVQNKYGNTILHLSVIKENKAMCHFLLKNNADKQMTNKWNMTPYLIAKYNRCMDMQEMFVLKMNETEKGQETIVQDFTTQLEEILCELGNA